MNIELKNRILKVAEEINEKEEKQKAMSRYYSELKAKHSLPIDELQEGYKKLLNVLENDPSQAIEKFEWMMNGSFGSGAYYRFWSIRGERLQATTGFIEAMMLTFRLIQNFVTKAFKKAFPTKGEQDTFIAKLVQEVKSFRESTLEKF